MKEDGRAFRCEPCRQIVIFFTVSDAAPYLLFERVQPVRPAVARHSRANQTG
jgi:hypothetical protein